MNSVKCAKIVHGGACQLHFRLPFRAGLFLVVLEAR